MSPGSLPGFLFRSVLTPRDMNVITSNCHSIPQPIFGGHKRFFTHSYRHRFQQCRQRNSGRRYKHSRLLVASGLGITLVTPGGSPDSDHLQNFCETNFDTIRHRRPSVPRANLPSFASCTPLGENSSIGITSKSLDDGMEDPKSTRNKLSYPSSRAVHQSFDSVKPPPFNHPPIAFGSSDHPHKKSGRTHPNQLGSFSRSTLVNHHHPPLPFHPAASSHHQLHYQSPSVSPPTSCRSSIVEASDTVFSAISSNYHQPGSTRVSHRLRNCHSLQFVKQKHHQPPHLSHSNFIYPQSRSVTPLTTSHVINQLPSGPSSSSQSTLSAAHDYSAACYPPEQLSSSAPTSVTSPPTKFTNFVRSTIQKTYHRSNSQSQSSLSLDSKSQADLTHLPSYNAAPFSHNHSSRSLALSATSEIPKPSLLQNYIPPLRMSRPYKAEIESLNDQGRSPDKLAPSLRSSLSQPVLTEHYLKTSLTGSRSHSALDARHFHPILKRTGSSHSGFANSPSVNLPGFVIQPQPPSSKCSNSINAGSPPRKSMRTQFSRLAQLLAPSPAAKDLPVTSRAKASSLSSKPKLLFSTSSKFTESSSKHASCTVLDPLLSRSQCASRPAPMTIINWRNTISDREYKEIIEGWGTVEIHRQQLIWELSQTEIAYLDSLNLVLDFFINPLKKSDCDSWVAGVPEEVQKMFSDLDQMADFHSEMVMGMSYNRMCEKKRNKAPLVIRFADMMAAFVPRLRIYERYLVCFEHVCTIIDQLSADQADNFGVFVKIQSEAAGFGGMALTSFLLKPIQRLMKYPLFFRQLCETTPVGHPDHLPTANLWKATDGIIRSMQDVKGLEDDHKTLQKLEEQLTGLPDGLILANRRRKLVARGTFQRVHPSHKDMIKLSEPSRSRVDGNFFAEFKSISKACPPSSLALHEDFTNSRSAHRMVRCLSPVSDSSENSEGTQSQSSYHSMNTDSTFDLFNSPRAPIPKLSRTSWSTSGYSAESSPCPDRLSQDWGPIKFKPPRSLPNKKSSHNLIKRGPSTELIEVILLSDLLIFCVKEPSLKKNWRPSYKKFEDSNRLKLLDGIGISRLMDAEDIGGQLDHFEDLVRLKLLPELNSATITKKKSQTLPTNENNLLDGNVIYLSSFNPTNLSASGDIKKSSHASMASWPGILASSSQNLGGSSTEQEWKNWLKEFKKLEFQTHHLYRRHLKHSEQKRRRSTTGKIDVSMKRCSSMNNLGTQA